ncbi:hypothetical protein JQ607_24790 [Bradyrhizobium liaoningense]|uniref:hypothetical protein n=1 Tax=Bradyrhizobium liaoningense TaxID=43992 RepID=UPI001BA6F217|nr:hypothetical protein [Bradyrhizobium liaoningense]MBR0843427.1 hypothetical protein [Bradyrhizobium liaoningense]MBR0856855.1 hypothetical protein [Bradyrhizobium liaoningense]
MDESNALHEIPWAITESFRHYSLAAGLSTAIGTVFGSRRLRTGIHMRPFSSVVITARGARKAEEPFITNHDMNEFSLRARNSAMKLDTCSDMTRRAFSVAGINGSRFS